MENLHNQNMKGVYNTSRSGDGGNIDETLQEYSNQITLIIESTKHTRENARKILFDELEKSGWQWTIFNQDNPDKNNGIIECIIDAMEKFKNYQSKHIKLIKSKCY